MEGDSHTNGDAPPGFERKPEVAAVDTLAAEIADKVQLANVKPEEDVDAPDPSLSLVQGLQEKETEIKAITTDGSIYKSAVTFEELGLSQELLKGIYDEMRFERPSKIQAHTLPMILLPPYRDLVAQAHNGSGKTTCFVLAMLSRVDPTIAEPQALCVCPTRELVVQNHQVLLKMAKFTPITSTSTIDSYRADSIREHVVIGTHGTLKKWMDLRIATTRRRILEIGGIKILVFDEADEMLKEHGFRDDSIRMIRDIKKGTGNQTQLVLFSATFNDKVKTFVRTIAPQANQVYVPKEELSLDVISQYNVRCPRPDDKTKVLRDLIFPNCENLGQTIIFVRSRETCRGLHNALERDGFKCTSVAGDRDKTERDRVVQEFRDGITKILIATDVLSRGLDVSQVTLVINYDIPQERNGDPGFETYLHRIGRSGRFGRKGAAFNLITGEQDERLMQQISAYFNRQIPEVPYNDEDKFMTALERAGLR